ncbi:MAG: PAS domain S-box protein, partial [Planctomycetes bacterium]|nr:PAS domain S-box protein [Planctomycetota bacterium]
LVKGKRDSVHLERRYFRKDRTLLWGAVNVSAIRNGNGSFRHTVAMIEDITARKLAEEALRASESRFRGLLEAEPDGVVVVDEAGRIDLVNTKAAKMFGYRREELFGEPIELVVPQGLFKKHVGHRARFLEQPQARPMGTELEVTGRRKDGSEFPADVSLSPLETDQGLFVMSIVRDITERKRTELALRESEERFRVIFESAPFGMAVVDVAGTHARYNRAFQEMLGYTEQELQERDVAEYTYPEDREDTRRLFSELREGKRDLYQLEKRYVRKDGRIVWGSLAFTSVRDAQGDVQYLIATVKDITEGKQAEAALRESEERLALALDATSEGLWDWNIATGEVFYSPRWCRALGFDPCEVEPRGRFWNKLVHPEDMPRVKEILNAHFEQKTELYECEVRLRTKSGEYRWNLDRGRVVARDEDGKPVRMIGVDIDITERKRAEEALRESEVKYRELFESASDVICLMNNEGNIVDINRRGELVTGYSRAELCQMNVLDQLVVPEDHAVCKEVIERAAPEAEYVYEVRWRTKQGKIVHFEGASTYRFSASGELMTTRCTLRDITERKRAEEQARQLQADLAHMSRLSSMGEMATGLAHELNQPLTVITNYAQGCVRRLKSNAIDPEELGDILGRIATQAQRSSSIIRGLGNLVRKSSALRFEIDINHCIMEVADLANAEATQHRAKARFELEPNLPLVMADQTQLQQVILNLVQNGCEAIGDTPESRRAVTVRTKQRGDRELEISVSDNGRGISEPLGERLFEPFFTTKAQGIGMGLAISRSIVESHGGRLWATPNRGEGTTFHFTLPIVGGHSGDE